MGDTSKLKNNALKLIVKIEIAEKFGTGRRLEIFKRLAIFI